MTCHRLVVAIKILALPSHTLTALYLFHFYLSFLVIATRTRHHSRKPCVRQIAKIEWLGLPLLARSRTTLSSYRSVGQEILSFGFSACI